MRQQVLLTCPPVDIPRPPPSPRLTLGVLHHKRLGHGRQLTLNVESQPPPTPLTTTIFRSCQSQLAKVQQKRTRFNIFAGKHPFSACCGHITRRASVLCGYIASTARNPALCTMWWILTIYWDQQLYSDAQSIHVFRQLASTGLPARTPAMSRRPRPGTERVAPCIG